jgi:hypothetical protein
VATDLFVLTSRWPGGGVTALVPPACRRRVEGDPTVIADGADTLLVLPELRPRSPARHLVPSLSVLAERSPSFRVEASAFHDGRWTDWVGAAALGSARFVPIIDRAPGLTTDVDVFLADPAATAIRIRVRLAAADADLLAAAPWLCAVSAWDGAPPAVASAPTVSTRLSVPALTQMAADPEVRLRICSPTSVGMVLAYWGAAVDPARLAAEMHHAGLDLYGVWPAAIRAAGRYGIGGYLLRFPDWASAAWCLARGLPIVASVRYAEGELAGAAVAATTGHLIVLTGYEGDHVVVNDPAAADPGGVARRYALADLRRVWLERAGVGYVLFSPSASGAG